MRRRDTLPLGIDIGATRIRVAVCRSGRERPELLAVASRPRGDDVGRALREAVAELGTRERRCVFGIGEPDARLRTVVFPPMDSGERERAARLEASRWIAYPLTDAQVRAVPIDDRSGRVAIGVARTSALASRCAAARAAKLATIAIDDHGCALRRAFPDADAVLDIGAAAASLHVFGSGPARTARFATGGEAFTQAIAEAIGTDTAGAERRKLAYGIAGCADDVRERLVDEVVRVLADCRADGYRAVERLALTGNGARLDDLGGALARATGVTVVTAAFAPETSPALPPDVLRAAAPDWSLAYGLALWGAA